MFYTPFRLLLNQLLLSKVVHTIKYSNIIDIYKYYFKSYPSIYQVKARKHPLRILQIIQFWPLDILFTNFSCVVGWAYITLILSTVAIFATGMLSINADKATSKDKIEDEILDGKRIICVT